MNDEARAAPVPLSSADEAGSLARELADAYARMVRHYQREYGLAPADADARARGRDAPSPKIDRQLALERPADQISWYDLSRLADHDPEGALEAWARVKEEARKELASGHRTAKTIDAIGSRPWDRARFVALRDAFRDDWQPRGGVEAALVEMLAISFAEYLRWTARHTIMAESEGQTEDHKLKEQGYWLPPRLGVSEAIEQSAALAERAHRRFLQTVRALQDVRRMPVYVASAGQVNIAGGGGQQINVAASRADGRAGDGRRE